MIENRIIVDKFALAEEFNKETLGIVNSILRNKYSYGDVYEGLDITEELETDEDMENYQVITNFEDYNRHDINNILEGLKPKKYKLELGKSITLLKHTEMFYLTLNRKAFTFLKYFTETYGK